jgi:hypothetical protein
LLAEPLASNELYKLMLLYINELENALLAFRRKSNEIKKSNKSFIRRGKLLA